MLCKAALAQPSDIWVDKSCFLLVGDFCVLVEKSCKNIYSHSDFNQIP